MKYSFTLILSLFQLVGLACLLPTGGLAQQDYSNYKTVIVEINIPSHFMAHHKLSVTDVVRIDEAKEIKRKLYQRFSIKNLTWSGNRFSGVHISDPFFSYREAVNVWGIINTEGDAIDVINMTWARYESGGDRSLSSAFSEVNKTGKLIVKHIPAADYGNSFNLTGKNHNNKLTTIAPDYFMHSFRKGHAKTREYKSEMFKGIASPISESKYSTLVSVRFIERQRNASKAGNPFDGKSIRVKTIKGEKGYVTGQYGLLVQELCKKNGLKVFEGDSDALVRIKQEAELNESGLVDSDQKIDGKAALKNMAKEVDATVIIKYLDSFDPASFSNGKDIKLSRIPLDVKITHGDRSDRYVFYGENAYLLALSKLQQVFASQE